MKTIFPLAAILVLGTTGAWAQDATGGIAGPAQPVTSARASAHDVTGFSAPTYAPGPGISSRSLQTPPNPHPDLRPKVGGALVAVAKYGPVMVSPTAPAELGVGQRYLSAPSQSQDLEHETANAAHRDAGGIKLFSLEF